MLSKATVSGLWLVARSLEKGVPAKVGVPFSLYRFCVQLLESRCLTEMEVRDLAVHHSALLDIFQDEDGDGKNPGLSAQHTARRAALVGRSATFPGWLWISLVLDQLRSNAATHIECPLAMICSGFGQGKSSRMKQM